MGMGMLFAGALAGGAKAADEIVDQAYKREEADRVRQQGLADRREAVLWEMKLKADMARQEEEATAAGYVKAAQRGAQIGNERGARELEAASASIPSSGPHGDERITPEMIASMPPAARAVYERQMGLTDDSELQQLRDQVTAAGEVGAPGAVRKGLLESYKEARKEDKEAKDRDLRLEQEDRKDARAEARRKADSEDLVLRLESMERRAAARGGSGGGGGSVQIDQTNKLTVLKDVKAKADASKPSRSDYTSETKFAAALKEWQESDDGQMSAMASRRMLSLFGSEKEDGPAKPSQSTAATAKPAAQQSAVKDNQTIKSSAPVVVKTQAQYQALPKGTRYTAPDGTVRIKKD